MLPKLCMPLKMAASAFVGALLAGNAAHAGLIQQDLSFSSLDQSMWGTGGAFQFDETEFIGTTWSRSGTAGGFVGGTTQILNPLWVAWNACPFLCPPEPQKFFTVDTTTGLQASASTQGRVGFEVGMKIDSGSVDALATYATSITIPDSGDLAPGEFVMLGTTSALTGQSLETQFPTMSASLSVVLEVSAQFAVTGCAAGSCSSASFNTGVLGGTQELVSFNEDGQGGIEYFGGTGTLSELLDAAVASDLVDLPTGFPATLEVPAPGLGNLATITAHLPQPNTSGGLNVAGTALTATGQDDLLDVSLDVDNLISVATLGTGGLFGGDVNLGGGFGITYDLVNVEMGPQIDLVQSFELTPTLYVDLEFSQPVNVAGHGLVSSLSRIDWSALPAMAFNAGITTVSPTFYLGVAAGNDFTMNAARLFNEMFLDVDGNIKVDLLTASFVTPFDDLTIGIGNLLNQSFDLFSTPSFFDASFPMVGFNSVAGASFNVQMQVPVPEPSSLALLGGALILLPLLARRRARA